MRKLGSIINALDKSKKLSKKSGEYWMARDIQIILGYPEWRHFENVIQKAYMACESTGIDPHNHFADVNKMVMIGSGANRKIADYFLTRYACYLIAMNGDPRKTQIGIAQSYFAIQARRQEISDKKIDQEKRIQLRDRVRRANVSLSSTAKKAGVQKYAVFHDAGYKGLYEMGLADIKRTKKMPPKEDLLDRAGRTELAANEFRITQAEEKLIRDNVSGEKAAIDTHYEVGKQVRSTIKKLGGRMPEDLPPEESIKKLTSKSRKKIKHSN